MNLRKLFLYLLIASVSISALVGIAVLIVGNFGELEIKVLMTALTVTGTSILGLACGAYLESGRGRVMPSCGIVFAIVSGLMWLYLIWQGPEHDDLFVKALIIVTILAAGCSLLCLLSLARLDGRFEWFRYPTHISVWLLTAYLIYLILYPAGIDQSVTPRIIGVLSIIVGAITLVTPVLHKLSSPESESNAIDTEIEKLESRIMELEAKRDARAREQDAVVGAGQPIR